MNVRTWTGVCLVVAVSIGELGACDAGGDSGPVSGTVTFGADEGVDLRTGKKKDPGNYANSDLYASQNGGALKLATGGDSPTDNRLVNWFKSGGGIPRTFASLADVPSDKPTDAMFESLLHAEPGQGFVIERADGGFTRGWLASADGSAVTIEFAPLDE